MSKVVRLPDPVVKKLEAEADSNDISRGAVAHMWMENYYDK